MLKKFALVLVGMLFCANDASAVVKVGMSCDYPPYEYIENNEVAGVEVDLLKEITKRTGIEFEIKNLPFNSIIGGVISGVIDIGVSGFTKTEERARQVDFSIPYSTMTGGTYYIALHKNGLNIVDIGSFAGKRVAVQNGTVYYDYLVKNGKGIKIVPVESNIVAVEMLKANSVEGVLLHEEQSLLVPKGHTATKVANVDDQVTMIFPNGSPYKKVIDVAIDDIIKDGTMDKISRQHLGKAGKSKSKFLGWFVFIAGGIVYTICYALVAVAIGLLLGLAIAIVRDIKPNFVLTGYISLLRGTPLLLQISFFYFVLKMHFVVAGTMALGINSSAYFAEIFRGGIESIEKGQWEAATVLGIKKGKFYRHILMPQVIRRTLPAMVGEVINVVKDTSLLSFIGELEIMNRVNRVTAESYSYFMPLLVAGACYYLISFAIEKIGKQLEKRFYYKS